MATSLGAFDAEYLALLDNVCNGLDTSLGHDFNPKFWKEFAKKLSKQQGVSIPTQSCIDWGRHHQMIYNTFKDLPDKPLPHPTLGPTAYRNFLTRIFRESTICSAKFPEGEGSGGPSRTITNRSRRNRMDLGLRDGLVNVLGDMHSKGELSTRDLRRIVDILTRPSERTTARLFLENNLRSEQVAMIADILNSRH